MLEFRTWLFPFEDHQLLSQGGILQGDVFVAGEDGNDKSQRAANRSDHDEVLWRLIPGFGERQARKDRPNVDAQSSNSIFQLGRPVEDKRNDRTER